MTSGGGDLPPNDTTRSPGFVPVLAFALIVLVAVAVVVMLRLAFPATPVATATPVAPAFVATAQSPATATTAPSATSVLPTATSLPATATLAPAPSPAKPTAAPTVITVTTPLTISLGVPTIVVTPTAAVPPANPTATPTLPAATVGPKPTTAPVIPPAALGVPPVVYSFYDWQNTDFAAQYPAAGAIGSLAVFGWDTLHTGPGRYDWSALDRYLAAAAAMTVTLRDGTVISKPIILEIVENESETPSKQIAHKPDGAARFLYHDHTPDFVRREIAAPLAAPITYTLPDGSVGRVVTDTGSYLAVVEPSSTCRARTVAIVPKYDNSTWQMYYRQFVAALGERYRNHPQIVALIFGPGIDQEYGQATKDYQGCALKAQTYKLMTEAAYLDTVIKPGSANDLAHVWRAAFPNKPLFLQFTSTGKDRIPDLVAAAITPPIGLKQATLVHDNNNQWQSNGRGTLQLMHTYSATLPLAWENAYDQVGTGPAALQNRYFTILAGLSTFPTFMDFTTTWIKELAVSNPWLLEFTRANLGRTVTTTNEVWVAMRGTEYWPPSGGAVTYGGWNADATYGLQRLGDTPLIRRADLQSAFPLPATTLDHPYSLMARRTDMAKGISQLAFAVDRLWPFRQQRSRTADPSGVAYEFTIKYLDLGTDTLSLVYTDDIGNAKSRTIIKTNSGQWVTATLVITDAYLAAGLPGGVDFALDADALRGGRDEVVHMVAIKGLAAAPPPATSYLTTDEVDRATWVQQQSQARATQIALARLPAAVPAPALSERLLLPIIEPTPPAARATPSPTVGAEIAPPGRPTIPPIFYAFYEWQNIDFGKLYPDYPPIGSQPVFGWSQLHIGPNQFDWTLIDTYLRDAARMTVTVAGTVISKPILLEIVENESEVYSSQIPHDPTYANKRDPWAARIAFHDYTPDFVRNAIAAPLSRPITYATTSGQIRTLTNDGGSYLVDVLPGTGACITRTVAIVPKYNNPTWQMYYKQFLQALGARYGNHPQIAAFIFGPGIDQEYGQATKDFFECTTRANPYMSDASYLQSVVMPGPNNDLLDVVRAAFPNKPVMLQFTGSGKDMADLAMRTQGYAFPVGLKQATLTDDNNNQYQTNGVGTLQIMHTYSQTTYIAWENAYAYLGPNPNNIQKRYFTLLAGLMSFPSYMDFIGGWMIDPELLDSGILHFVQPYLGRTITTTDEVWVALRDTSFWPPTGGAIRYGGWPDDFTYALYRHGSDRGINNPVIRRDQMSQAPFNLPWPAISHYYALIARRTDNASGNNVMSFYTDGRWGYNNQTPKSVDAAQGAWFDVTLKYVDKGTDTLSLRYLDASGVQRTHTITKTNTNTWVTTTIVVTDAVWSRGLQRGADLILDSDPQRGGLDEIVHMVMIKGHRGGAPTPTPSVSPTARPTRTPTRTPPPTTATATPVPTGTVTPGPSPTPITEIRVNAGGPEYLDSTGKTWVADQAYTPGSWGHITSASGGTYYSAITVTGTTDPQLFQSERYFARGEGGYAFDIANGQYEVELGFAEIFGRDPGKRVFHVDLEGVRILPALDVAALVGLNAALTRTYQITITDNQININLVPISDSAKISTIRISPSGSPTATPTRTATAAPATATFTATPTRTAVTPMPTATPSRQATASPTAVATNTPTHSPTATATRSLAGTRTPVPTATPDLDARIGALESRYQSLLDLINRLLAILRQFGSLQ